MTPTELEHTGRTRWEAARRERTVSQTRLPDYPRQLRAAGELFGDCVMKTKPIIFSGPMIKALLEGRKTQTRRVLKLQPPSGAEYSGVHFACDDPPSWFFNSPGGPHKIRASVFPDDLLWVRETALFWIDRNTNRPAKVVEYKADGAELECSLRWTPSIHMPRWASRLTLEVTDVRVERVQDISANDALAEGIVLCEYPAGGFFELWDILHGKGASDDNPWIAAYTFTVHHRNVDDLLAEREVVA